MNFGQPLSRPERWLIWLWFVTSGAAAAAMAWGVFGWWIVFIVTIPFVFGAFFAPTLWLYLTPALLVWLLLRRWQTLGVFAAGGAMALVAVGVPNVMNRQLEATVRKAKCRRGQGGCAAGTLALQRHRHFGSRAVG